MEQNLEDIFKVTRGQVEHVENNMGQRIIWLVIAQSFFFNGYAVIVTGNPEDPAMIGIQHILKIAFPVAGLITVALTYLDIIVSLITVDRLRKGFDGKKTPGFDNHYPPVDGLHSLRWLQRVSPLCLPLLFIVTWLVILSHQ